MNYDNLTGTAIVVIRPEAIDDRPALDGSSTTQEILDRVCRSWPLDTALRENLPVTRLVAITKTEHVTIADIDLDPNTPIIGDAFVPATPINLNPRGTVGTTLDLNGTRLGTKVTWSADIRQVR